MSSNNIIVAVRVRPFNEKELASKATSIITMNGQITKIKYEDKEREFKFDNSFWSTDGFVVDENGYAKPDLPSYVDQRGLFEKLGRNILNNAWEGYNCTLFAYGQTGSGKTYSVMGYYANKGIVPIMCEELFLGIDSKISTLKANENFQVLLGVLEVYNENLKDLLNPSSKEYLSIKDNSEKGFYAHGQIMLRVNNYKEILQKIEFSNKNRTIASTNMNKTSSRAHTVVTIQFNQTMANDKNCLTTKKSLIHLVDLAGSEKVKKSGAEGDRLFEARKINQSLSFLGDCLRALSEKHNHVPFRNSVLTKLLMNALGGNSKTVLLATISPCESNYEETMSTLRFAERAKTVTTNAKINVSETDKIIKSLKEDNLRLLQIVKELEERGIEKNSVENTKIIAQLQDQIKRNSQEVSEISRSYSEQLDQAKAELEKQKKEEEIHKLKLKQHPHIYNLNDDPSLNKVLIYFFEKPLTIVGSSKFIVDETKSEKIDIEINGLNILPKHAEFRNDCDQKTVFIRPISNSNISINGEQITNEIKLNHLDRILFGNSFFFFFYDPRIINATAVKEPTIDDARMEITKRSDDFKKMENDRLLEELSKYLPFVEEVNTMAKEMNRKVIYNLVIFQENLPGYNYSDESKVFVRVFDTNKRNEYFIGLDEFSDRRFVIMDMYNEFIEGVVDISNSSSTDPFLPNESYPVCIGFSSIILVPLVHYLNINEDLKILNFKCQEMGNLIVEIVLCEKNWNQIQEITKNIEINDDVHIRINIKEFMFLQNSFFGFSKIFCRFKFQNRWFQTKKSKIIELKSNFSDEFKIQLKNLDKIELDYLTNGELNLEVWGNYGESVCSENENPVNDTDLDNFFLNLKNLIETRKNHGHKSIKISSLVNIAPEKYKNPKTSVCVIQ